MSSVYTTANIIYFSNKTIFQNTIQKLENNKTLNQRYKQFIKTKIPKLTVLLYYLRVRYILSNKRRLIVRYPDTWNKRYRKYFQSQKEKCRLKADTYRSLHSN